MYNCCNKIFLKFVLNRDFNYINKGVSSQRSDHLQPFYDTKGVKNVRYRNGGIFQMLFDSWSRFTSHWVQNLGLSKLKTWRNLFRYQLFFLDEIPIIDLFIRIFIYFIVCKQISFFRNFPLLSLRKKVTFTQQMWTLTHLLLYVVLKLFISKL